MTRILIYDDDQEILLACKIILQRKNYRVETKMFCDNVIDDILFIKPDIILMDLWIPEMGGEKAVGLVRNNKLTQHVPVILFSANAKIEEISEKVNANGYIKKPFEIATLLGIIEKNVSITIEDKNMTDGVTT